MYCTDCGAQLDDDSNFCPYCGSKVGAPVPARQVVQLSNEIANEKWDPFVGEIREFPVEDSVLTVPVELDLFNKYRLKFRELASECADNTKAESSCNIRDLMTYLEIFPEIYDKYLHLMTGRAIDLLIAEGVWTVTHDSFFEQHIKDFRNIPEDLEAMLQSVQTTIENNQSTISSLTGLVPNLIGGGFGLSGAMKGIAEATVFNIVRDTAEAGLINKAGKLNQAQKDELYGRINFSVLYERAFLDYWHVFLSLANTLKSSGKEIWYPSEENTTKAANIFENLSNPNFPEAKKLEVFLEILKMNPYDLDYQKYMISQWGETEQTTAIKNYFGFTDFNDPRMI